jgi:hypothetical protein
MHELAGTEEFSKAGLVLLSIVNLFVFYRNINAKVLEFMGPTKESK